MPEELKSSRRRRAPAHRAENPGRTRLTSVGGLLTTAVIIGTGTFFGLSGVGETYAFWNSSAPSSSAAVTAGALKLTVGGSSASYALPASSNLFPGDSVMHSVTVAVNNTPATLPAQISMKLDAAFVNGFVVRVKPGACPGAPFTDGVLLATTETPIGTWGGTQSSPVCVQVSLPSSAPSGAQGKLENFTISVTARQLP